MQKYVNAVRLIACFKVTLPPSDQSDITLVAYKKHLNQIPNMLLNMFKVGMAL